MKLARDDSACDLSMRDDGNPVQRGGTCIGADGNW
jgi:hypothetical protein